MRWLYQLNTDHLIEHKNVWVRIASKVAMAAIFVGFFAALRGMVSAPITLPYLFFIPAVMASGYFGGFLSSFMAVVFSGIIADYFFLPPYGFYLAPNVRVAFSLFIVITTGIATVSSALRQTMRRQRDSLQKLSAATQEIASLNKTLEQRIADEIEKRNRTELALRQAQKMEAVGQLTGGLAHDFNNLLTGIMGSLDLLGKCVDGSRPEKAARYISTAQHAAERATSLTHRLLAFSRRQTLEPTALCVCDLIISMEDMLRRSLGPSITLNIKTPNLVWYVMADQAQLESSVLNMCLNSRDAMPDGGRITLTTWDTVLDKDAAFERNLVPGEYMRLVVADTGTGMSRETMDRIFEPFFTTKPLGAGSGLGLSMVYGFAKQSGGVIRALSEVGKGTSMELYLPRYLGEINRPSPRMARQSDIISETGGTILVVDDEVSIRALLNDALTDAGYVVLLTDEGGKALEVLRSKTHIDLLLSDVGLPGGINGRQLADAARLLRPYIPVILITGYAEQSVLAKALEDMQIVTKPFAIADLLIRIKKTLEEIR